MHDRGLFPYQRGTQISPKATASHGIVGLNCTSKTYFWEYHSHQVCYVHKVIRIYFICKNDSLFAADRTRNMRFRRSGS